MNQYVSSESLLRHTWLIEHLQQSDDSAAICKSDGEIIFVNAAWQQFSAENSYAGDDFIGMNYFEICETADGAEFNDGNSVFSGLAKLVAGDRATYTHTFPCHGPTEQRWFRLSAMRLTSTDEAGRPLILITHTNVTDTVETVQPATSIARDAKFAHDINSSINPVLGYLQLAHLALADNEEAKEAIQHIEAAEQHGYNVSDYLKGVMLRAQNERVFDQTETLVNFGALIKTSVDSALPSARKLDIRILSELTTGTRFIGVSSALRRMIDNLLSNAIKYNNPDGSVDITLSYNRTRGIKLTVKDTGVGIETNMLERIFDPFERGDQKLSAVKGDGLGLSSTKQIVEQMGGTIQAESTRGIGSTFTVSFPSWRTVDIGDVRPPELPPATN